MRLTAYISREGEQIAATRTNRDSQVLVLSVLHDATNQLLSIAVHPDGMLTCEYSPVVGPPGEVQLLGRFFEAGMLLLQEPHPLADHIYDMEGLQQ